MENKPKYSEDMRPKPHRLSMAKQELNLDVPQFWPLLSLLPFNAPPPHSLHICKKGWETELKLFFCCLVETL